jgi:predicted nucleic acid-binding protein
VKVLLDTSILVAALVRDHPRHAKALPWLARALAGELEVVVAAHSLAELHATLTTLPVRPRISPETARRLRQENLPATTDVVALGAEGDESVVHRMSELDLAGGVVYDALIARAAELAGVELLVTLNETDFRRAWPEGEDRITAP